MGTVGVGVLHMGEIAFSTLNPRLLPKGCSCTNGCYINDTLAWATGMRVGAGDHAIAFFYIEYGCVLGLYSDPIHFEV